MADTDLHLNETERSLLNDFQHGLPLESRPFARVAEALGVSEAEVLDGLQALQSAGVVSRVGPVFRPNRLGVSTLAALSVPQERLAEVAELVNAYAEVNHNYEREHEFNLWFVVTAPDVHRLQAVLDEIAARTGLEMLDLPMLEDYFIDLGFRLQWT
ncbi:MAG: Lrp/AsnC family transcriptional regulator [Chromatiales bacterium]|jgi:DNA-binding Lrp family transcriptional regulator